MDRHAIFFMFENFVYLFLIRLAVSSSRYISALGMKLRIPLIALGIVKLGKPPLFTGLMRSARNNCELYRAGYPGQTDDETRSDNVYFYEGKIPSRPQGALLLDIHAKWAGNYKLLEDHHYYIQWLFPIREEGLNDQAQVLLQHEIDHFKKNPDLQKLIIKSYRMMLHFYGMKLADEKTGEIKRGANYRTRYRFLNNSFHNYLRISRILKCLGEVGLEYLKEPLCWHFMNEIGEQRQLQNCFRSLTSFWILLIRDDDARAALIKRGEEINQNWNRYNFRNRDKHRRHR